MFSNKEIDYLKGKIKPNQYYERVLRSRISRKIRDLKNETIPILIENDFTKKQIYELINQFESNVTENSNGVTEFSNIQQEKTPSISTESIIVPNKRRDWDSNPGWSFPHSGFQDRRLQPLGHPSNIKTSVRVR